MDGVTLTSDVEVAFLGLIGSVIVAALALLGVWLQSRKTREQVAQQAAAAAVKVEEVRALAEPTGNGFADKVTAALGRIEDRQLLGEQRADREAIARLKLADELAAYREEYARDHQIPHQVEHSDDPH